MPSITKIILHDFQSWKNLTLDLGKVNVIAGESDVGKTSIMRALSSVAFNSGYAKWIRWGCNRADVEVHLSDGNQIRWIRNEDNASYEVTSPDGRIVRKSKIGRSSVPGIMEMMGFRKVRFDKDLEFQLNIRGQHDEAFALSSKFSGPMLAKIFSKLSGSNIVILALRELNKDFLAVQQDVKLWEGEFNKRTDKVAAFSTFPDLKQQTEALTTLIADSGKLESSITSLSEKLSRLEVIKEYLISSAQLSLVDSPTVIYQTTTRLQNSLATLQLAKLYLKLNLEPIKISMTFAEVQKLEKATRISTRWDELVDPPELASLQPIELVGARQAEVVLQALVEKSRRYDLVLTESSSIATQLRSDDVDLVGATQKLDNFRKETGVCPTCHQKWLT